MYFFAIEINPYTCIKLRINICFSIFRIVEGLTSNFEVLILLFDKNSLIVFSAFSCVRELLLHEIKTVKQ